MQTHTKYSSGGTDLLNEAAALTWLSAAEKTGGIHISTVIKATSSELVEEKIASAPATPKAAEAIGRGLAHMHAAGASWFGQPPTNFHGAGYIINGSVTEIVADKTQAKKTWGAYFAAVRIEPFVKELTDEGLFSAKERAMFEKLCEKLRAGSFDAPQPRLVQNGIDKGEIACARLHGDLWAVIVLYDANPQNPTRGALIDPMAHGGHAETDLAMLQLFGFSYLDRVLGAYNEVSPLTDGWQIRVSLHQLAPLLHHCILFGSSYVSQTIFSAARYL